MNYQNKSFFERITEKTSSLDYSQPHFNSVGESKGGKEGERGKSGRDGQK